MKGTSHVKSKRDKHTKQRAQHVQGPEARKNFMHLQGKKKTGNRTVSKREGSMR